MSDRGQPDPARRDDPDATRQVDPDATRRVDPGPGGAGDPGHTQRIAPVGGTGGLAGDDTEAWEGTADPYAATSADGTVVGPAGDPATDDADDPAPRHGRDAAFGIGGLVLGFLIAVVVIALGTSDRGLDGDVAASSERVEALEADLDEREARIAALEARVADAEAAAGQSDADIEAQRQALDERSQALDERVERIDERSQALDARERELDDREAAIADRERGTETDDGGEDGFLPNIDTEQVETFFDRMLERIRDLF